MLTRGPYLQSGSSTGIVVRWRTDVAVESRVVYRATDPPREIESSDGTPVTEHATRLASLKPDTTYFYSVGSYSETLAGGSGFYFRTSPTNTRPIRVWATGDTGSGTTNQTAVRDVYLNFSNSVPTDVWLMLGDNVYNQGLDTECQQFLFDPYQDLLRHTILWPAIGNHDAPHGWPSTFLDTFTPPRRGEAGGVPSNSGLYFSFDYANVHFVCLDSWVSSCSLEGTMLNWLNSDLSSTTQDWVIAYWHHPPYSMGTDFSDSTSALAQMREHVVPILESHGVDLVLSGHSHVYERSFLLNGHYGPSWTFEPSHALDAGLGREDQGGPYRKSLGHSQTNRGTVYVVCGNSGQGGPVNFRHYPAMAVKTNGYGSMVLDINGLRLDAKYLRSDGGVADYFTIDKSARQPVPTLETVPRLDIAQNKYATVISWPASPREFLLESSSTLPGTNWEPVADPPSPAGSNVSVRVVATNAASFFRLRSVP